MLGTGAAAALCCVDYHTLARWSWSPTGHGVAPGAVLVFGTVRFGARRWFDLGFFSLQPSEFAKLAFILAQAHFLSRPVEELRVPADVLESPGAYAAAVRFDPEGAGPRLGAGALADRLAMMFVAARPGGTWCDCGRRRHFGAVFLVDVLFTPQNWQIKLEDYQRRRLMVYFSKEENAASRGVPGGARTPAPAAVR